VKESGSPGTVGVLIDVGSDRIAIKVLGGDAAKSF